MVERGARGQPSKATPKMTHSLDNAHLNRGVEKRRFCYTPRPPLSPPFDFNLILLNGAIQLLRPKLDSRPSATPIGREPFPTRRFPCGFRPSVLPSSFFLPYSEAEPQRVGNEVLEPLGWTRLFPARPKEGTRRTEHLPPFAEG